MSKVKVDEAPKTQPVRDLQVLDALIRVTNYQVATAARAMATILNKDFEITEEEANVPYSEVHNRVFDACMQERCPVNDIIILEAFRVIVNDYPQVSFVPTENGMSVYKGLKLKSAK